MNMNKIRAAIGLLLLLTFLSMPFNQFIQQYVAIPNDLTLFDDAGENLTIPKLGNDTTTVLSQQEEVLEAMDTSEFKAVNNGESSIVYEVAGMPLKKVNVDVLEDFKVIPGGQSVGVNLQTLGVLVVGHHLINTDSGEKSPGEDADIQVGDIILQVNGKENRKNGTNDATC